MARNENKRQKLLGSRKKINPPTCLPFAPSSALRKRLHSKAMRPFTRLEDGPKSSAFWRIYFLPQPLLKKKKKDKERRNKKSGMFSGVKSSRSIIKNARELLVNECLINPQWKEEGMATILISRKQADGKLAFGTFMVDIFCLGLKKTFCNANMSIDEYENTFKEKMYSLTSYIECDIDLAHQIIYGAIDFAMELGFEPQKGFKLSKYILEEPSEKHSSTHLEFGKDGKPFFIAGPDDNVDLIIRKLSERVGVENFNFTHPMGM